jgi:hypothetical protein
MKYHIVSFLALSISLVRTTSGTDFKAVLDNPYAYHHKRVTLMGVARIRELDFDLYREARAAKNFGPADKAVSISMAVQGPRYDEYDNRWVEITGIVDANRHGRLDYPCVVYLESVRPIPRRPAGAAHVVVEGIFMNHDTEDTYVTLVDQAGRMYAEFQVPVHKVNGTGIRKGTAILKRKSGEVIARHNILSPRDARYFDVAHHAYYYRIADRQVHPVRPNDARKWMSLKPSSPGVR